MNALLVSINNLESNQMNCRSTVESTSNNDRMEGHVPPQMYHLKADVYPRSEVEASSPHLFQLLEHAHKHLDESSPKNCPAVGVLIEVEFLRELVQPFCDARGIDRIHVADELVAFMLPPEFESDLANLAMDMGGAFNHPTVSLARNSTYVCSPCLLVDVNGLGHSFPGALWVAAHELSGAMGPSGMGREAGVLWGWSPLVFVSGNTVVVGGFPLDTFEIGGFQAATISAQSYQPMEVYADDEIAAAKQLAQAVGETPWCEQLYPIDGVHVLAVNILRATR